MIEATKEHIVENDGINIGELLKKLLKQRGLIIAVSLILFLLSLVFQLSKLAFHAPKTINYPIAVDFISTKSNSYPNGTKFSILDIIAPSNIKSAINKSQIDIQHTDNIIKAVSIINSNSIIKQTEDKLLSLLNNKKLPETMVETTKDALGELRLNANIYATLKINLSLTKLSVNDANTLLSNIVSSWAESSQQEGLITPNISYPHTPFTTKEKSSVIDNYDDLLVYANSLQKAAITLSALKGSDTIIAKDQSLNDLIRETNNLTTNDIEVMRTYAYSLSSLFTQSNPLIEAQLFSQLRVKELNKKELQKVIDNHKQILESLNYSNNTTSNISNVSIEQQQEASVEAGVINELLGLGSQLSSSELKKEIIKKQLSASKKLFKLEKEIEVIQGSSLIKSQLSESSQQRIITQMPEILQASVEKVNDIHEIFMQLLEQYKKTTFNKSNTLYTPLSAPYVENALGIPLKKSLLILAAALVMGFALGCVIAILRITLSTAYK